jgi:hypothetical protein
VSLLLPTQFWPRSQQRFRERFETDATTLPSRPVHIRWFTSTGQPPRRDHLLANAPRWQDLSQSQILLIAGIGVLSAAWIMTAQVPSLAIRLALLALVAAVMGLMLAGPSTQSRRVGSGRRFVAVFRPDAEFRSPPTLVVEVDRSAFHSQQRGQGPAMLVGRVAPNAALCLLSDGIAVWPIGPAVRRMPDAPGR